MVVLMNLYNVRVITTELGSEGSREICTYVVGTKNIVKLENREIEKSQNSKNWKIEQLNTESWKMSIYQ